MEAIVAPRVVVPPVVEPVLLEQAAAFLRLDDFEEHQDHPHAELIEAYISAARHAVESDTRRSLVVQTLETTLNEFPSSLQLLRPPYCEGLHVSYYDESNQLQTLSADLYELDDFSDIVPTVHFKKSLLPSVAAERRGAVKVRWNAGYAPEGSPPVNHADFVKNIPKALITAILMHIQMSYESFEPQERQSYYGAYWALVARFRVGRV